MESQPQNPEFRNIPETFTHAFIYTINLTSEVMEARKVLLFQCLSLYEQ